jgi:hypothetical protein
MSQDLLKTGVAVGGTIGTNLVVTVDSTVANGVKLPAAATNFAFGVTQMESAVGKTITVQTEGEALIKCSATVARGAFVKYGTDGRIATASATDTAIGVVLKGADANELARVYIARQLAV